MSNKGRWFSNTPANGILVFSILIIGLAFLSSIWFMPFPPPHIETDKPVYMLTFATMLAAALTLWVSWLIKEEAKEISQTVTSANSYLVQMESLKSDFSLLMDVAAIRLEQLSKLPRMNEVVPIENWNDLPILQVTGIAPGQGMPKESKEYINLFKQIDKSMSWFTLCFKHVSGDLKNLGQARDVFELMPKEHAVVSNESNKISIKLIDELIESKKRFDTATAKADADTMQAELSNLVICISEVVRSLCTKSKHSANFLFMAQAYTTIVRPVLDGREAK